MKKPMIRSLLFLLFVLSAIGVMAQREVTGTVSSTDGELLPGVSVVLKGTLRG